MVAPANAFRFTQRTEIRYLYCDKTNVSLRPQSAAHHEARQSSKEDTF